MALPSTASWRHSAEPDSPWVDLGGEGLATPASTLKLWTAAAVLDAVPSNERLSTDALWDSASGTVILVGGGDATLETDPGRASGAASLTELATVTAKKVLRANEGSRHCPDSATTRQPSPVQPSRLSGSRRMSARA